jgi:uncharacterized protein
MQPNALPPSHAARAHDLTDAEFVELEELLFETPEPLEPLELMTLDGYLCGVIVQPVLLEPATWLAHIFDFEGRPLPEDVDPQWLRRITAHIMRRYSALNRAIGEDDGMFDPLVLEFDEEEGTAQELGADEVDPVQSLNPISRTLMPWVLGFLHATECFPDLAEMHDDAVMSCLARLFRHLPAETDEEREIVTTLDREYPLATLDEAIADLVATVAELQDLTREQRFKVDTVKRETPKVGRNDPCPCASGKKFKQCHGAS